MPQPIYFRFHNRPGLSGWARILLILGFMVALTIVIAFIALGILIFILPVLALTALAYYLLPRPKPRPAPSRSSQEPVIIDGEFRVVNTDEGDRAKLDDRTAG